MTWFFSVDAAKAVAEANSRAVRVAPPQAATTSISAHPSRNRQEPAPGRLRMKTSPFRDRFWFYATSFRRPAWTYFGYNRCCPSRDPSLRLFPVGSRADAGVYQRSASLSILVILYFPAAAFSTGWYAGKYPG